MKIAVIGVKGIPAKQEKIERYCQEFYPRIAVRGHQVDLFIDPKYHRQPWFSIYFYRNIRAIALASLPGKRLSLLLNSAFSTIWATFSNYDVIHIQGMAAAWFCWFPQLFSSSKVIITSHELDSRRYEWHQAFRWLLPWMERTAVKNADELIVVSKALGEYYQAKYHIRPRYIPDAPVTYPKIETAPEFRHGKALGLKPQKYLLYLGNLDAQNQPDLLLQAFQQVETNGYKLVIAGEIGASVEYAIELLAIAKKRQDIIFINQVRGEHLAEIVRGAALLVVPADNSDLGLPPTVLEAMREGTPVLANDTPVHRELLGNNRGLLFESGELSSLVAKLEYALCEPQQMKTIGHKAQTHIAIYHNWDRVTYGNLSMYLKVKLKTHVHPVRYRALDN